MMKLNLGCGARFLDGWVNVDHSIGAKLAKYKIFNKLGFFNVQWDKRIFIHNLRLKFPWQNNSVDTVYSSHTLEHFDKREGLFFLKESHRVLKKGGVLRIIVPDLEEYVNSYIEGSMQADDFIDGLLVLNKKHKSFFKTLFEKFFSFPHRCMYDKKTLLRIFTEIGFDASIKDSFESNITDIKEIEIASRTNNDAIIEGIKL